VLANVTVSNLSDVVNGNTSSISALLGSSGGDGISLREAILAANNTGGADNIVFDSALTSGGPATIQLSSTGDLIIDSDITIEGPGRELLSISAYNPTTDDFDGSRLFYVSATSGAKLTISDLTLMNGDSGGDGGAILTWGDLDVARVNFENNVATNGGALATANYSIDVSITDSDFVGNRAGEANNPLGYGGAIYISAYGYNELDIMHVDLDSIRVYGSEAGIGGGIYVNAGQYGEVTLTDSVIGHEQAVQNDSLRNIANWYGGGVAVDVQGGETAKVTITGTQVINNRAEADGIEGYFEGDGGGIHLVNGLLPSWPVFGSIQPGEFTFTDSVVSGNTAEGSGGGLSLYMAGDMNYAPAGNIEIERTTFADNSAQFDGGGIHFLTLLADVSDDKELIRVADTTIHHNVAYGNFSLAQAIGSKGGGGVFVKLSAPGPTAGKNDITFTNTTVSSNRALSGGGVMLFGTSLGRVKFSHSTIAFNTSGVFAAEDEDAPEDSKEPQKTGSGGLYFYIGSGPYQDLERLSFDHTIVTNNVHLANEPNDHDHYPDGDPYEDNDTERNRANDFGIWPFPSSFPQIEDRFNPPEPFPTNNRPYTIDAEYSLFGDLGQAYDVWNIYGFSSGTTVVNADPELGPLAPNRGPTLTHLPGAGGDAINAGNPSLEAGVGDTPEFDQRGNGYTRVYNEIIDIGAVERQPVEDDCKILGDYNG